MTDNQAGMPPNQELFDLIESMTGKVLVQSELCDIIRVVLKNEQSPTATVRMEVEENEYKNLKRFEDIEVLLEVVSEIVVKGRYDFNADPEYLTLKLSEAIKAFKIVSGEGEK